MLQNATVNKLRCAFVKATYDYFYCQTYSLDCCLDEAKELYLAYKLTQLPCELTTVQECTLESIKVEDYTIDCQSYSPMVPCSDQYTYTVSVNRTDMQLYVHCKNLVNGEPKLVYEILDDEIYHEGTVWFILTNSPTVNITNGVFTVPSGFTIFDSESYTIEDFASATGGQVPINWFTNGASYIKTVRLSKTTSAGIDAGDFEIINTDPSTSPYLSCVGCTTVNPAHLVFGNVNWSTAFSTLLKNAVLTLSGDTAYIEPHMSKAGNPSTTSPAGAGKVYVNTLIRHEPTTTHYGFKPNVDYYIWVNQFDNSENVVQVPLIGGGIVINDWSVPGNLTLNGPSSPVTITWAKKHYPPSLNNFLLTDFDYSPYWAKAYPTQSFQYTVAGDLSLDATYVITVTVQANNDPAYTISLIDSDDNLLATSTAQSLTYTTTTAGEYTVTITGAGGCTFIETITLE